MEKVTVSKEVAEAIEDVSESYTKAEIIAVIVRDRGNTVHCTQMRKLISYARHNGVERLMRALVNGYEAEKSPEDNLREYYGVLIGSCDRYAVKCTLNILGIPIEGINA